MTKISLVLTSIEETRTFNRTYDIEDFLSGQISEFAPGTITRSLVFNNGEFKTQCDQETFNAIFAKIMANSPKNSAQPIISHTPPSVPDNAETFGGDEIPPAPDMNNWSGMEDEGEDGVGQV